MDYDYEKDQAIDPHALDEEWLMQPNLYMRYSVALAQAQKVRDKSREKLEVVRAELDGKIRKVPVEYGIPKDQKITEAVVTSTILVNSKFIEAQDSFAEENLEVNLLQAAVRTFDHRKKALENLVTLHIASYFAGPKEPRNLPPGKRMADKARDKASEKQRENLNVRKNPASERRRRTRKE